MDSVDDFQTDLKGWDVMNRSSNHCDWEGIQCAAHFGLAKAMRDLDLHHESLSGGGSEVSSPPYL